MSFNNFQNLIVYVFIGLFISFIFLSFNSQNKVQIYYYIF
jgi:uncharacterized membrane protein YgaE (UPF0421/DUF939 family)